MKKVLGLDLISIISVSDSVTHLFENQNTLFCSLAYFIAPEFNLSTMLQGTPHKELLSVLCDVMVQVSPSST